MRLAKRCWMEQKVMNNMPCYIWFENVLYADYDYIRNVLIRPIHMWLCEKRAVFVPFSSFNNLFNTEVEVNETTVHCRSLLPLPNDLLMSLVIHVVYMACFHSTLLAVIIKAFICYANKQAREESFMGNIQGDLKSYKALSLGI